MHVPTMPLREFDDVGYVVADGRWGMRGWTFGPQDPTGRCRGTLHNGVLRPRTFTNGNQRLIDTKGREFEADPEASLWTDKDSKSFLQQINPGNSVKGKLIYDVPRGTRLKAIDLHDSMFSGGVTVPLGNR